MKRLLALITIFTLFISLAATSSFALDKIKEADKLYKQALKIEKSKPKDAIKLLNKAIAYNPKNPEYYYKRGYIEPNFGKAFLDYDRAIVLNPDKYFELCYGGTNEDGVTYHNNLNGFTLSTKVWDLYETDTISKIKKQVASFKGDRVKNATKIMQSATDDTFTILNAKDADQNSGAIIQLAHDRKNEVVSNESFATLISKEIRTDSTISNIGEITKSKLGNTECAYFDYNQTVNEKTMIGRNYSMAFDYYVLNITLVATDQAHFDAALKDFINTYK